ncbi:MAG: mycofactocin biosynthesis glycosyltransferase MftF [Solirubrobacterales bacterium]
MTRHVLDRDVRRSDGGRLLAGGVPARLVRLSPVGAAALDALLAGRDHPGAARLGRRLREQGLLHPVAGEGGAATTFVVPVRNGGAGLAALVRSLRAWGEVIVVDDRSTDDSAGRAARAGARVIANHGAPGPAGARNAGLAAADSGFVAFVDADCACPADWARPLADLLAADPGLALVAPRIRSAPGPGAIARFERRRSPLDMGPDPALVGRGRRVAYVPATALVGRRRALLELGGFDEELRFGEDVDLVWRLVERGWRVRYAPERQVAHRPRPTLAAFARQRFEYGSSAARLDRRHPGAVAPLRLDRRRLALALAAGRGARSAAAAASVLAALAAMRRTDAASAVAVARLAARADAESLARLAGALSREWAPLTLAASLASRRARRLALACLACDLLDGGGRPPAGRAVAEAPMRLLDNLSYAAGLWHGALSLRSPRALLPAASRRRPGRRSPRRHEILLS